MRKLVNGASIILILISVSVLLRMAFDAQQVKSTLTASVATTPTPNPNTPLVSTTPAATPIATPTPTPTPDPTPERTPTPTPVSTPTSKPLKSRVVKHQPDQFRKGALSKEELSAIKKAIKTIRWSRNSDPKAAADEDYAAIVRECQKSSVHDLLTDLVTEAVSNDYQANNEAANSAYFTELNSDFENGIKPDRENQEAR
jgi:outer membrane biosynthesis protein TonB